MNKQWMGLALAALGGAALAADGPDVKISGFGTFGLVRANTDQAQFRDNFRQPRGASTSLDFGVDSRLALQGNVRFSDTFSAAGQLLTSRRMEGDGPMVEWLYGQADLGVGVAVKLGRMVMPTYLLSDSRSAGYSQHWLRAPNEIYAAFPAQAFDGAQLLYRGTVGSINLTGQIATGRSDVRITAYGIRGTLALRKMRSFALLAEKGDWAFRASTTVVPKIEFVGFAPPSNETYSAIGAQFDNGQALVMSEFTKRKQSTGGFDLNAYYVSAGWRFGAVMPYATYSFNRYTKQAGQPTNDTTAVGLRWDAAKNVAVKFQVDDAVATQGNVVNATPSFFAVPKPKIRAYSAAVDFTF